MTTLEYYELLRAMLIDALNDWFCNKYDQPKPAPVVREQFIDDTYIWEMLKAKSVDLTPWTGEPLTETIFAELNAAPKESIWS